MELESIFKNGVDLKEIKTNLRELPEQPTNVKYKTQINIKPTTRDLKKRKQRHSRSNSRQKYKSINQGVYLQNGESQRPSTSGSSISNTSSETLSNMSMEDDRSPRKLYKSTDVAPYYLSIVPTDEDDDKKTSYPRNHKTGGKFMRVAAYVTNKLGKAITLLDFEGDTMKYASTYKNEKNELKRPATAGSIYK
mmetsp:Transcript_7106/g.10474  ORF Transcript_7106/g.10474 Transcript_7106/m.10474 type:complete len:193 (+) Transcript_7106:162-740(+)